MDHTTLSPIVWLVACQFLLYALGWVLFSVLLKGERAAMSHWGAFMALVGAGFLLAAQRDEPRTWWPYVASNILWVAGYTALRRGLERFNRQPPRDAEHLALLSGLAVGFIALGSAAETAHWRVVLAYGGGAVIVARAVAGAARPMIGEFGVARLLLLALPALIMVAGFGVRSIEQMLDPARVLEMQRLTSTNRRMLFGYLAGAAMFNFSFVGLLTLRLFDRLRAQARLDPLTGLLNRRAFEDVFASERERMRRGGPGFAVLALDLDHFKRINDVHGHLAGDAVLAQTAQRLRRAARQIDTVARTGGEEFVVLVPQADRDGALAVAERLRLAIGREPFATPGGDVPVTLSVGVAWARADDADPHAVLQRADRALYDAKAAGRDQARAADD